MSAHAPNKKSILPFNVYVYFNTEKPGKKGKIAIKTNFRVKK